MNRSLRGMLVAWCVAPALVAAATVPRTAILLLSGDGTPGHPPVRWEFTLDAGRGAGVKSSILVPSCWEQQGFAAVSHLKGGIDAWSREVDPAVPRY